MIYYLVLFWFVSVLGSSVLNSKKYPSLNIPPRIINGRDASLGQFPWQVKIVTLTLTDRIECNGAIISDQWILTSAHCINNATAISVYAGIVNTTEANYTLATNYTVHEDFVDSSDLRNDIGVAYLDTPLDLNDNIQPIPLAEEDLPVGTDVTISGWGYSANGDPTNISQILQYATVTTIENSVCQSIYGVDVVFPNVVCAIGENPLRNPCVGDGGAPLVIDAGSNPVHVGIFSFISSAGCDQDYPAGYIRTFSFRGWIRAITGV